jgi:hypothetical protein
MSLTLIAAIHLGALKCPKCDRPIQESKNYQADIVTVPQLGGAPVDFIRGETVTLKCSQCGWSTNTTNWQSYLKP